MLWSMPSIPGQVRACLQQGPFARYMTGEAVSMTGTWMQMMAQSWVMTSLTTSAAMMGLVNFASGMPMLALSLSGGVAADRYDRRNILLATQVAQIALALLVGFLVATGRIEIWHIVGVAFLLGISAAFEFPAVTALVPELVQPQQIATAIAIDRSVFHGTRLIGPAVAGYVIGLWGTATAFFLNALSFVALIAALVSLPRVKTLPRQSAAGGKSGGVREGFNYVRSDRPTLSMVALMSLATVFVFPVLVVMLPLYARQELHLGPDKMGLLMGASAMGSFTGALGLMAISPAIRRRVLTAAVIGVTVGMTGLAAAPSFGSAAGCLIVLALSVSTLVGLSHTVVQERAPPPLRGRVSSIAGLSFFGLMPFASLGITSVADAVGMREALAVGAGLFLVCASLVLGQRGGSDKAEHRG